VQVNLQEGLPAWAAKGSEMQWNLTIKKDFTGFYAMEMYGEVYCMFQKCSGF
jgi:hypothetical protein